MKKHPIAINNSLKLRTSESVIFVCLVCVFVWNESCLTMTFCLLLVYWFWYLYCLFWHFSFFFKCIHCLFFSHLFYLYPQFQYHDEDYRCKDSDANIMSCNIYSPMRILQMNVFIHYVCHYHESRWHNDWRLFVMEFIQLPPNFDLSDALFLDVINISSETITLRW